ncbi:helix-turn-helix transcriptional regulator [Enterococcus nangangensis]|uniref:helix-turn-helix transcriptional regulator n=1 Tax=Enterococcus nangangensis TaxID=2559926 RepID=UPI0010F72360|nr:helix-turn-helix domain-containing protein [Enterococcus nangangensis]
MKNKIREMRISKGISQKKLAETVGISRPYLAEIEKGSSAPGTPIALALASALDSTVEIIFSLNLSYEYDKT